MTNSKEFGMDVLKNIVEQNRKEKSHREVDVKLDAIINEELGISDFVYKNSVKIKNHIKQQIENTSSSPINMDMTTFKRNGFYYRFIDNDIVIRWDYYSFADKKIKEKYNSIVTTSRMDVTNRTMLIIIQAIKGKFNDYELIQTIQHELEHFYENKKRKFKPYNNIDDYRFVIRNGIADDNEYIEAVKNIIYLSKSFEQRAFANGLYAYLMDRGTASTMRDIAKTNSMWIALQNLKYYLNLLKTIDKESDEFQKVQNFLSDNDLKMSIEKLIQTGEKTVNGMIRIIGRTIVKAEQDSASQNHTQFVFNTIKKK